MRPRRATPADAGAIAAVHTAGWRSVYRGLLPDGFLDGLDLAAHTAHWRTRLTDPRLPVLVAEGDDGPLDAFCALGPTTDPDHAGAEGVWQIHQLYVSPARRGGGIGGRLFDAALDVARAEGARVLSLWVVEQNAAARRFYERHGMQPDGGRRRNTLAPGAVLEELRYVLPLGEATQLPTATLRPATRADLPAIEALIDVSARALSAGFYSPAQIESLLRFVFGADTRLVDDGTYFVIERSAGLIAAGGWSRRRTLYGGDRMKSGDDPVLDPAREPARIRAFFVHPSCARQGLGRRLFDECRRAAAAAGFRSLALVATLPGEPLYRALGFEVTERRELALPDGAVVPVAHMTRAEG